VTEVVPSFILKGSRAEKHLHDLKIEIDKWADTHPYEVRTTHYRKRDVHNLRFTSQPPPEIGLIAADCIHNLRSGLDHLMASLVPAAKRSSVYFPIYFAGVWDSPVPGEETERTKARGRWNSDTEKVRPEAVAILKSLQPAEGARDDDDPEINAFLFLNHASTKDRHQKLPLVFSALRGIQLQWKDPEGNTRVDVPPIRDRDMAQDGAELQYPPGAMEMKVAGTPFVALKIALPNGNVDVREALDLTLTAYRTRVVEPLHPYVWVTPKRASRQRGG
jgi:hypothetical protein